MKYKENDRSRLLKDNDEGKRPDLKHRKLDYFFNPPVEKDISK